MLNDARDEDILNQYPPTAVIDTSDRMPHAFWVIDRKHGDGVYDAFMGALNAAHGDPAVVRMGWDTRLAGFFNKKFIDADGKSPIVRVRDSSTRRCVELERAIDEFAGKWKAAETGRGRILRAFPIAPAASPEAPARQEPVDLTRARGMPSADFAEALAPVPLPDWIRESGLGCQRYFAEMAERNYGVADRSKVDSMTVRQLFRNLATPDEVYTFMLAHMTQDEEPVPRLFDQGSGGGMHMAVRIHNQRERDRQARRMTANNAPLDMVSDSWRSRNFNPVREEGEPIWFRRLVPWDNPCFRERAGMGGSLEKRKPACGRQE